MLNDVILTHYAGIGGDYPLSSIITSEYVIMFDYQLILGLMCLGSPPPSGEVL
jgi:hypothetical protein